MKPDTNTKKHFSFLEWAIVISFSLLFLFTLYTSSSEFLKKPEDNQSYGTQSKPSSKESCEILQGKWIITPRKEQQLEPSTYYDYCDLSEPNKRSSIIFENALKSYTLNEYIFIGIFSLLGILIGYFIRKKSELASFALIAASIFSIIVSHITHWELVSGYMT